MSRVKNVQKYPKTHLKMFKKIHNLFLLIHHEHDEVFGVPVEVDALDHQVNSLPPTKCSLPL